MASPAAAPRVIVDRDACVGTGDCARLAPAAFRVRDDLLVAEVLAGAAMTDRKLLSEAAEACPMQAISIAPPTSILGGPEA